MMIDLLYPLPKDDEFFIAVSGGIDSMCGLHWLLRGKRKPRAVIHVNHGTAHASSHQDFVLNNCEGPVLIHEVKEPIPKGESKESFWRKHRYGFFRHVQDNIARLPIVVCHTLNDCLEQYIYHTMCNVRGPVIPYRGPHNVIRPFRTWSRKSIYQYAERFKIPYRTDQTNFDTRYMRNRVRVNIVPELLKLNPGLLGHVKKLVLEDV